MARFFGLSVCFLVCLCIFWSHATIYRYSSHLYMFFFFLCNYFIKYCSYALKIYSIFQILFLLFSIPSFASGARGPFRFAQED